MTPRAEAMVEWRKFTTAVRLRWAAHRENWRRFIAAIRAGRLDG